MKKNIVLIGMPGCGKSTLGVVLAKRLNKHFIDTDIILQNQEGELLQTTINNKGLDYFKAAEEKALFTVSGENLVIATGGSAVYSPKGMEYLKSFSKVVYISLSYENFQSRLVDPLTRGIAISKDKTLKDLYDERVPLYQKYADIVFSSDDLSFNQSVEGLISILQ